MLAIFFLPSFLFALEKDVNYLDFTYWYENQFEEKIPFQAAAVIEYNTLKPLYYHQERRVMPAASLMKLITAGALMKYPINWNNLISFSWWDNEGDLRKYVEPKDRFCLIKLEEDEIITREQAFGAMLIGSANNAANGLVSIATTQRFHFIDAMQRLADEWGMKNTIVQEPTGLSLENLTTAQDMALAACRAFEDEYISKYSSMSEFTFMTSLNNEKNIKHTVHDLRDYPENYFGAKTGYLHETGFHLTAGYITPQGKKICVAILSTSTRAESEDILNKIGEWVDIMYINKF